MTKRSRRARPIGTPGTILAPPIVRHLVRESPPRRVSTTRVLSFAIARLTQPRILFTLLWLDRQPENWPRVYNLFARFSHACLRAYWIMDRDDRRQGSRFLSLSLSFSLDRLAVKDKVTQRDRPLENRWEAEDKRGGTCGCSTKDYSVICLSSPFTFLSRFLLDFVYLIELTRGEWCFVHSCICAQRRKKKYSYFLQFQRLISTDKCRR